MEDWEIKRIPILEIDLINISLQIFDQLKFIKNNY